MKDIELTNFSNVVLDLAKIIANDKNAITDDCAKGAELIEILCNPAFAENFKNLRALKIEALLAAIDDLSTGAERLRVDTIGICFWKNKLSRYGGNPEEILNGEIVYSIGLKNVDRLKSWRENGGGELSQEDINTAIYFLVVQLAEFTEIFD